MSDLLHNQEEADAATHARLRTPALTPTNGTPPADHRPPPIAITISTPADQQRAQRLDPSDLRTVHMPELRSPEARLLDAAQRGYDGSQRDTRTFDQVVISEFVRLVDVMQALRLEFDLLREEWEKEHNGT